jgi:hypothetical protein
LNSGLGSAAQSEAANAASKHAVFTPSIIALQKKSEGWPSRTGQPS